MSDRILPNKQPSKGPQSGSQRMDSVSAAVLPPAFNYRQIRRFGANGLRSASRSPKQNISEFVSGLKAVASSYGDHHGRHATITAKGITSFRQQIAKIAQKKLEGVKGLPPLTEANHKLWKKYECAINQELANANLAWSYHVSSISEDRMELAVVLRKLSTQTEYFSTKDFSFFNEEATKQPVLLRYAESAEFLASGLQALSPEQMTIVGTTIDQIDSAFALIDRSAIRRYAIRENLATTRGIEYSTKINEVSHVVFRRLLPEKYKGLNFTVSIDEKEISGMNATEAFSDMGELQLGSNFLSTLNQTMQGSLDAHGFSRGLAGEGIANFIEGNKKWQLAIGARRQGNILRYKPKALFSLVASNENALADLKKEVVSSYKQNLTIILNALKSKEDK